MVFTESYWSSPQRVVATTAPGSVYGDQLGDITLLTRSEDPLYDGQQEALTASVLSEDSVRATVSPAAITMSEGDEHVIEIALHAKPSDFVYAVMSSQLVAAEAVVASDVWPDHDLRGWAGGGEVKTAGCSFGRLLEASGGGAYLEKEFDFADLNGTDLVVTAELVAIGDWQKNGVFMSANGEQLLARTITVTPNVETTCGDAASAVTLPVEFVTRSTGPTVALRFATDLAEGQAAAFGLARVSVRAAGQPLPDVCALGGEHQLGGSLVGFAAPESWQAPIDVVVVAMDDDVANEDRFERASLMLCSHDARFHFNLTDIHFTVADDEARTVYTDRTAMTVVEGGRSSYQLWLSSQPGSAVEVRPAVTSAWPRSGCQAKCGITGSVHPCAPSARPRKTGAGSAGGSTRVPLQSTHTLVASKESKCWRGRCP